MRDTLPPGTLRIDGEELAKLCGVDEYEQVFILRNPNEEWVAYVPDPTNAERIVACVNACEGIDDPAAALAEARRVLEYARVYVGMEGTEEEHNDLLELLALLGSKA